MAIVSVIIWPVSHVNEMPVTLCNNTCYYVNVMCSAHTRTSLLSIYNVNYMHAPPPPTTPDPPHIHTHAHTQLIALLAFATTAGFNSSSTGNSVSCLGVNNTNYTGYMTFGYPFSSGSYNIHFSPMNGFTMNNTNCSSIPSSFSQLALAGSAQFFVAMGILTILYVIGAVLVYLLFITPKLFMAKWLVIGVSCVCVCVFTISERE